MCIGCNTARRRLRTPRRSQAYLFAVSPAVPNAASTSVFCAECWRDLSDETVEAASVRVLRRLLAAGRFTGPWGTSP